MFIDLTKFPAVVIACSGGFDQVGEFVVLQLTWSGHLLDQIIIQVLRVSKAESYIIHQFPNMVMLQVLMVINSGSIILSSYV